jgi:hypothetical protein
MLVSGHDLLNRSINLPLFAAGGESLGQQQGLFLGLLDGLDERPHTGHCRIKFTLAIELFGVSKRCEQLLQLLVFNGCQMAVRIHRQDQKIKKCPMLGGGEPSEVNVRVKRLPEVEDDFKAIQESSKFKRESRSPPAGGQGLARRARIR